MKKTMKKRSVMLIFFFIVRKKKKKKEKERKEGGVIMVERNRQFESKRAVDIIRKCSEGFYSATVVVNSEEGVEKGKERIIQFLGYWSPLKSGDLIHMSAEIKEEGVEVEEVTEVGVIEEGEREEYEEEVSEEGERFFSCVCGGKISRNMKIKQAIASILWDMRDRLEDWGVNIEGGHDWLVDKGLGIFQGKGRRVFEVCKE